MQAKDEGELKIKRIAFVQVNRKFCHWVMRVLLCFYGFED